MSGCVGPRFSFTHYPKGDNHNGPGVSLVRPIPDCSAPSVTFLGMAPKNRGGAGLAMGTLGPMIGEVGTSSARVLVEVRRRAEQCCSEAHNSLSQFLRYTGRARVWS